MKKWVQYVAATVVLAAGLTIYLHGSRKVLQTYQRESTYIETARIGMLPTGSYLEAVRRRGMKDGLVHILIQAAGTLIAVAGGAYLGKITNPTRVDRNF